MCPCQTPATIAHRFGVIILLTIVLMAPQLMLSQNNPDTAVWTDKNNYTPGEVVTVTGVGFQPGEIVNLVFQTAGRDDRTSTANADENGGFTNNTFSPDSLDAEATIKLIAVGATSGFEAMNYFLDGPPLPTCDYAANAFTVDGGVPASSGRTFKTIQEAINTLPAVGPCLINIKAGTYNEAVVISGRNTSAASDSQRVIIRRDPTVALGLVTVSSASQQGNNKKFPLSIQGSKYITIQGLKISGASDTGVSIGASSSEVTIAANDFTGNANGVGISSGQPHIWVYNNFIHANSGDAVSISGPNSTASYIVNNTMYANSGRGIQAVGTPTVAIVNNLVVGNSGWGIQQTGTGSGVTIVLKNNMTYKNTAGDIASALLDSADSGNYVTSGSGTGIVGCTFSDCANTHANSQILDASGHLAASSPAIDNGLNSYNDVVERVPGTDIDGDIRPVGTKVDIGSDERPVTTPPPAPVITAKPDSTTNQKTANFSFTETDVSATLDCDIDGLGFLSCSSPVSYPGLTDGSHTFTVRASNAAGNSTAQYTWTIDTAMPSSSASVTDGTAGDHGWYKSNVTVTITATKTGGTVKQIVYSVNGGASTTVNAATAAVNITTEGTTNITFHSVDTVGNVESPENTFSVKIDKTAPTAKLEVTAGTLGKNSWYTSAVTLHASGTDANAVTCDADVTVSTDTAGQDYTLTCTDEAGWSTQTNTVNVKLDTTDPTASVVVTAGTAGANGWYTSDVTVSASGTDNVSGPVTCTPASKELTSETAGQQVTATCENAAGRTSSGSVTVKIDKTAPTDVALGVVAGTQGDHGWYTSDVTVRTTGKDDVSGVTCSDDQFQSAETKGSEFNGSCTNGAGLKTVAAPLTIKLDKTGPTATLKVTAGTAGSNGWYVSDVTVQTSGDDTISAPVTCTADQFQGTETTGTAFNGSCKNDAGLTTNATPLTVKLDKTPPEATLAVSSGTAGENGWYISDVTLHATGTDTISAPVTCDANQTLTSDMVETPFKLKCTNDAGLSSDTNLLNIKMDKTPPSAQLAVTAGTLGANGWYTSDIMASASGEDNISGPVTCSPTPQYVNSETAGQTLNATCKNQAGLTANASALTVKLDKTPPEATLAVLSGTAGENGWYISDVTLHATGTDTISAPVICDANQTLTSDMGETPFKLKCTNDAGLSSDTNLLNIKLDKTAPSAQLAVTAGTLGLNGWYVTDVTAEASGEDNVSGPVTCTPTPQYVTAETAGQTLNASCKNQAGLTASASALTVKLDKTPPTATLAVLSGTAGENGWYISDVTLHATGADTISAPVTCDANQTLTSDMGETPLKLKCTNDAGLSSDTNVLNIKLDKTPPSAQLAVTAGTLGLNGWYTSDVTAAATGEDNVSGPVICTPTPQYVTAETAGQTLNATCKNQAGLTANASALTLKLDKTPPTNVLLTTAGTLGKNGWYVSDVTVTTSGVEALSAPVICTAAQTLTTDSSGTAFNGECTNQAGLSASATALTIKRDATPPVLSSSVSPNPVVLNGTASASAGATDATSLVASSSCGNLVLNSVGGKTVTCTATDNAGNSNTATVSYSVVYAPLGTACMGNLGHAILQPIDFNGSSVFKQKSTVPAKFRVCDANGASIGTAGVVSSFRLIQRMTGTIVDTVDEAVDSTTPNDNFRWDPTAAQWIFNMGTKGLAANVTYFYRVTLNDGTFIDFNFGLK